MVFNTSSGTVNVCHSQLCVESDFVEINRVFCVGFELASLTYAMFSIR